ncbi:MAG: hypothetical protein HXS48_00195 [Theionarchaea archaeon]|nr:hypothetical protein [Theionarchaea archaeon]
MGEKTTKMSESFLKELPVKLDKEILVLLAKFRMQMAEERGERKEERGKR